MCDLNINLRKNSQTIEREREQ